MVSLKLRKKRVLGNFEKFEKSETDTSKEIKIRRTRKVFAVEEPREIDGDQE